MSASKGSAKLYIIGVICIVAVVSTTFISVDNFPSRAVYRTTKLKRVLASEPTLHHAGNLYFVHHFFNATGEMLEADIHVTYKK